MFRKNLLDFLVDNPVSVYEIAHLFKALPKDVEKDLEHLAKSLKRSKYRMIVTPARCKKCGFTFSSTKILKPGKCPHCHSTWISNPLVEVVRKK